MSKDKMSIRDYITIGIVFVLQFAIYIVIGTPIGSTVVGLYFLISIMSIPWGILSMLMYTRVSKKGTVLAYSMIFSIIQLMNFWVISVISVIFAIINELIWRHGEQKRFVKMMIAHIVFILGWLISSFLP